MSDVALHPIPGTYLETPFYSVRVLLSELPSNPEIPEPNFTDYQLFCLRTRLQVLMRSPLEGGDGTPTRSAIRPLTIKFYYLKRLDDDAKTDSLAAVVYTPENKRHMMTTMEAKTWQAAVDDIVVRYPTYCAFMLDPPPNVSRSWWIARLRSAVPDYDRSLNTIFDGNTCLIDLSSKQDVKVSATDAGYYPYYGKMSGDIYASLHKEWKAMWKPRRTIALTTPLVGMVVTTTAQPKIVTSPLTNQKLSQRRYLEEQTKKYAQAQSNVPVALVE